MPLVRKYFHLWTKLTLNSFMAVLTTRFGSFLFLIGKILRFVFFSVFLFTLFTQTKFLAGYSLAQTLFFYMTFNLIDTTTQLFFREVYRFRPMVVNGDFDLVLVKPISPLFRALAGGADPLDLFMLIPYVGALIYIGTGLQVNFWRTALYLTLFANALVIAAGFHILVLALAILTTEIDHAIMIYRDLTNMGRMPVDIYHEPLRSIITFVIPVGVMMTFPAKALMGVLSPGFAIGSLIFGAVFIYACYRLWQYALSRYASASS